MASPRLVGMGGGSVPGRKVVCLYSSCVVGGGCTLKVESILHQHSGATILFRFPSDKVVIKEQFLGARGRVMMRT